MLADDKLFQYQKTEIVLLKPDDLHKNNGGTEHERYALLLPDISSQYMLPDVYQNLLTMFNNQKIHLVHTIQFCNRNNTTYGTKSNYSYIHICELLTILSSWQKYGKEKKSEKTQNYRFNSPNT